MPDYETILSEYNVFDDDPDDEDFGDFDPNACPDCGSEIIDGMCVLCGYIEGNDAEG